MCNLFSPLFRTDNLHFTRVFVGPYFFGNTFVKSRMREIASVYKAICISRCLKTLDSTIFGVRFRVNGIKSVYPFRAVAPYMVRPVSTPSKSSDPRTPCGEFVTQPTLQN